MDVAINSPTQTGRRATQRERLHAAMLTLAAAEGVASTTVAKVIAGAGVSRPTFYEYFPDRDACFLAVLEEVQRNALVHVERAILDAAPARAAHAAVNALVGFARAEPQLARVAVVEALAGGPGALELRDGWLREVQALIETRYRDLAPETGVPDLSSEMLLGGVQRLLVPLLRAGEVEQDGLTGDLLAWMDRYVLALGAHRWRTLERAGCEVGEPALAPVLEPPALPRGRQRMSRAQTEENRRQRIVFAAARVSEEKGYAASTIAEITRQAGVDGRAFHRLFCDKEAVFMALYELQFQQVMAVTAGAFFKGRTWPERVWQAGKAFGTYLEQNRTLAHAIFIESYAGGPITVRRIEDGVGAFTIFLQEGRQDAGAADLPPVGLRAIAATNFEMVYHQTRAGSGSHMLELLPHAAQLTLAPFLGPAEASRVIDRLTAGEDRA